MPKIFLPDLMAIESWDDEKNTIIYDDSIFQKVLALCGNFSSTKIDKCSTKL